MPTKRSMHKRLRARFRELRFDLPEVSGALGDLGTFIPLTAAMIAVCGLDGGTVLVFAGLFNVTTGLLFNQPIPVQPMKAIAAVAIAEGLAPAEIAAAGFGAGLLMLALALFGAVRVAERWIPRPVVRGIQLGIGLKFVGAGLSMVLGVGWWGADSRFVAIAGAALVLVTARNRRFPSALVLFLAGLVLLAWQRPEPLGAGVLGWGGPVWIWPDAAAWHKGVLRGALPQIPLTLLNSVIAVCVLSGDLFPGRAVPVRSMALSVGLMNTTACLFGAMPCCHGSGGLAGQYRFGARSGGSVVLLGVAKGVLGVGLGAAVGVWLGAFPVSILGVLLAFAGLELAAPARECTAPEPFLVAVATAGAILAANTLVGFLIGMSVAALLRGMARGGK
jgi:hypothetical protein